MQDIFLLVGRRLGVVSDMLAGNGMLDDLEQVRRHPDVVRACGWPFPVAASTLDIVMCRQRKQAEEAPQHTCYCLQRADCAYELPRYIFLHSQRYRKMPGVEEPTRIEYPPHLLFRGSPLLSSLVRVTANHPRHC
jgi:hypothetical protein